MLKNHLKIAWRNLRKNKVYSSVTLFGLIIGIASVLLIFRMVNYELSFNKNFTNYDRIVRIVGETNHQDRGTEYNVCTPYPMKVAIQDNISQFEAVGFIRENWSSITVPDPAGGTPLKKFGLADGETAFFVSPGFFEIFDFNWLAGTPTTALSTPDAIVITQTTAEKCFGDWQQAFGKVMLVDHLIPVKVTGVITDLPDNCDFTFPFLLAYSLVRANEDHFFYSEDWGNCSSNDQLYALLQDASLTDVTNTALAKVGQEEYKQANRENDRTHVIQPLSDLHYNENYGNSGSHVISKDQLWILSAIGMLILILACFNFINLSTAQASLRAKEVGVRKTLGGRQGQLISQFITETGLVVFIAIALGTILAIICSPLLTYVSDVPEQLAFFHDYRLWWFIGITGLTVTLLAGLYPSLVLAGFQPVNALKNTIPKSAFSGVVLRKSLVVLQFVIAQALIVGAIITLLQLDYIRSRDLGFSKDLIYTFQFGADSSTIAKQSVLKHSLLQIPGVRSVSFSSDQPLSGNTWSTNFRFADRPEDEPFSMMLKFCDADYQDAYGMNLLAGRWYQASDTMREAVINQTFLTKLGIQQPEEIIGQTIRLGSSTTLPIVGVVADFHTHSLREKLRPLLMSSRKRFYWEAGVNISPDNINATLTQIQAVYDKLLPEQIFNGRFLDESIAAFYENDNRLAATCKGFGFLAILISCLGLFGLATHAASRRIKEIGIRKVLGASVSGIVSLLSKDFLQLVLVALIIAAPLAWFAMNKWLENFAFRIDIPWWVFGFVGVLALLLAFATVSYQSIRAALANPVESLKNE